MVAQEEQSGAVPAGDQGPRPDWAALYERHRGAMLRVAASRLRLAGRDTDQARDVVNQVFVEVMSHPPATVSNWESYLVRATSHRVTDRLSAAEARRAFPAGTGADDPPPRPMMSRIRQSGLCAASSYATGYVKSSPGSLTASAELSGSGCSRGKRTSRSLRCSASRKQGCRSCGGAGSRRCGPRSAPISPSGWTTTKGQPVTNHDPELLASLADQYLDFLAGNQDQPPSLQGLSPAQRREVHASWSLLRASWHATEEHVPPPLADDPLARALGLVPDPRQRLDGQQLAQARKNRGLKASQLADLLTSRGWDVPARTVVRWEMADSADIAPALLAAIAEVLGVPAERLAASAADPGPVAEEVEAALRTTRFAELAARWAAKAGLTVESAQAALRQTMVLATARRGAHLTSEQ